MPSLVRSFCLIAFLFAAIPGSLASPSNTSPADDPEKNDNELRAVIEKFFELYANEDLEGLMRMWSEKSPDYAARKKAVAELFAKEDYRASNLTITRVKVDGDKASLRASVQVTTLNTQTKTERQEKMIRNMLLARARIPGGRKPSADCLTSCLMRQTCLLKVHDHLLYGEHMRISILGSGLIGGKLGTILALAGHDVVCSYSRSRQKLDRS